MRFHTTGEIWGNILLLVEIVEKYYIYDETTTVSEIFTPHSGYSNLSPNPVAATEQVRLRGKVDNIYHILLCLGR